MRGIRAFLSLVVVVGQIFFAIPVAQAESVNAGKVVIAQVYPGATGTATQEYVEFYNDADAAIDITGWCVQYVSSTGKTTKMLGCFTAPDDSTTLWLGANDYALFMSNDMKDVLAPTKADGYFSAGINAGHGYIRLVDVSNNDIDKLGWGDDLDDATYPAAKSPDDGKALQRKTVDFHMQDTNNDANDFTSADPLVHASGVYEEKTVVDECPNLSDTEIPDGYLKDDEGNCQPDSCLNLGGLQMNVPDGYDSDEAGNCTQHDECDNLPDAQLVIPDEMVQGDDHDCVVDYSPLVLTEILPNPTGSDSGNEFVEIYNSGDTAVNLTMYMLKVSDSGKVYSFPTGSTIGPGEYRTFGDSEMNFTLVNSSSRVVLTAVGGAVFGDTGIYTSPPEGVSWALIASQWQYTNRPTPGAENLASIAVVDDDGMSDASSLKPCAPDQFRNPETNRCKKTVTVAKSLTPCKVGQSRNPETNRCRGVLGASTERKPCADGQYRSEDTGRCRKLPASSVPDAAFAVQPVKDAGSTFIGWWALGGVGLLAVGYGAWEWRSEFVTMWQKVLRRFHRP